MAGGDTSHSRAEVSRQLQLESTAQTPRTPGPVWQRAAEASGAPASATQLVLEGAGDDPDGARDPSRDDGRRPRFSSRVYSAYRGQPQGQPPAPGGGGGGGGGWPAGNGNGYGGGGGGGAPAGRQPEPRIDSKFRIDVLPTWDGDPRSALTYFADLRRWAELGGSLPEDLGRYAPLRFKGAALEWWDTISRRARDIYRQDVVALMDGIRSGFLSDAWVKDLTQQCVKMEFREPGYAQESPAAFLRRCALIVNALFTFDEEDKVAFILSQAPLQWLGIFRPQDITTVEDLMTRAAELKEQLIQAAMTESSIDQRIQAHMSRILGTPEGRQFARRFLTREPEREDGYRRPPPARAHLAEVEDEEMDLIDLRFPAPEDSFEDAPQSKGYEALDHAELELGSPEQDRCPAGLKRRTPAASVEETEDRWDQWLNARAPDAELAGALFLEGQPHRSVYRESSPRLHAASSFSRDLVLFTPPALSFPPPREIEVVPRRTAPSGFQSVGVGVLSAMGKIGSALERDVPLRFDSGASLSLGSDVYLNSMKNPPKLKTGLKISIAQLTDQSPRVKGYVTVPVRIPAEDGSVLVLNMELYVVSGMTVPILLGEDFQQKYELNILRNVELGTKIRVGESNMQFAAQAVPLDDEDVKAASKLARAYKVIRRDLPSFVSRKQHKRDRANRLRRKRAHSDGAVRAWKDVLIPAESTKRVPIAGDFQKDREWIVEPFLIPQADETFLTVPNTLLSVHTVDAGRKEPGSIARVSTLPVTNPTKVPRLLRAGTLLGYAKDPQQLFEAPGTAEKLGTMQASAHALAALVQ
ncbi:hypothetical protein AURDEDRAFT_63033, partial [Auricularia subglabra TFB-10046 SS5]